MSTVEFQNSFYDLTQLLRAFAMNLTKNSEAANDLYQETAYRAFLNRDKFRPGTNFKAWLYTIMKNIFINNYRKRVKSATILDGTDNSFFIDSGGPEVLNQAETSIFMDELWKMIEDLDEGIKVPFNMHFEGFKYQEIADKLELPLGTVKSRIFFARKELKKKIREMYGADFNLKSLKQAG